MAAPRLRERVAEPGSGVAGRALEAINSRSFGLVGAVGNCGIWLESFPTEPAAPHSPLGGRAFADS